MDPSCIVCQPRTGAHKRFVWIEGSDVIKGPYTPEAAQRLRELYDTVRELPHVVLPTGTRILRGSTYFVFPNLAHEYPVAWRTHKESFSNLEYKVLIRDTLVKLRDADYRGENADTLLYSLCCLALLGVGDMHPSNILFDKDKRRSYIIDIEDRRTKPLSGECFYWSKPSAMPWLEFVRPHYPAVREMLKGVRGGEGITGLLVVPATDPPASSLEPLAKYKGIFNSKTPCGWALDSCKSRLQKYIRRNMPDKATQCALEMLNMKDKLAVTSAERGVKAVTTNLLNRICVIACEDIGLGNLGLVRTVLGSVDTNNVMSCIHALCKAEKTRLASWVYRAYATPEGQAIAASRGLFPTIPECESWHGWKAKDPLSIRIYADRFYSCLMQKDLSAVYWLDQYDKVSQGLYVVARNRRRKPMAVIWEMMSFPWLAVHYWTKTEKRPFLILAVLAHIYETPYDLCPIPEVLTPTPIAFTLDNYVLDMHTREGKRKGKTRRDFVEEGSEVTPVSEMYYHRFLHEIYNA